MTINQINDNQNMLHNYNYMYPNHNSNIKCVCSTIRCIDFKSIHYAINLNVVSFSMMFSYFYYMFLSMYC